jgi:hypothetical protein
MSFGSNFSLYQASLLQAFKELSQVATTPLSLHIILSHDDGNDLIEALGYFQRTPYRGANTRQAKVELRAGVQDSDLMVNIAGKLLLGAIESLVTHGHIHLLIVTRCSAIATPFMAPHHL